DQVMRGKAGADQSDLSGLWFVHREMAVGALDGEQLGGGMFGALFAKGRVLRRTNPGGEPHTPPLVEHWIVHAGLAIPDGLIAPVRRRRHGMVLRGRSLWIAHKHFGLGRLVVHR